MPTSRTRQRYTHNVTGGSANYRKILVFYFFASLALLHLPFADVDVSASQVDSVYICRLFDLQERVRPGGRYPIAKRPKDLHSSIRDAYIISESSEDFPVTEPPERVRWKFGLSAFYRQWTDVDGYPVIASENVNPYAVKEAAWLIRHLTSHRPDVLRAMVNEKAGFIVIAYNEMQTQIPEYSNLRPSFYWDLRARGLGTLKSSCGEENLLNYPEDPYSGESIAIHEFSHSMHLDGMNTVDSNFDIRIKSAYEAAIANGLWTGTYASVNHLEYWAEGVQTWFNAEQEHFQPSTRAELIEYDPELAMLLAEVFGETDWRYTIPEMRTHLTHLKGFDPLESPMFEWPTELVTCNEELHLWDGNGGDKWINLAPYRPSQFSSFRSRRAEKDGTEIIFVNRGGSGITGYSVSPNGKKTLYGRLASLHVVWTDVDQIWSIEDDDGSVLALFQAEEKTGRAYIGPSSLAKVSGEDQQAPAGEQLPRPFVVSVLDQIGITAYDVNVNFDVIAGEGTLSIFDIATDIDGEAATTLTLDSQPGTNTVEVRVAGLQPETFSAVGFAVAQSLIRVSGFEQEGPPGTTLANPFVVFVRDQNGNPFTGTPVTFSVTTGEGTLSAYTDTTGADGRASTTLTLGNEIGVVVVVTTAEGLDPVTFTSIAKAKPDFDSDGVVGFADLLLFAGAFGFSKDDPEFEARFDLDGNGMIGFGDFLIFAGRFGNKV